MLIAIKVDPLSRFLWYHLSSRVLYNVHYVVSNMSCSFVMECIKKVRDFINFCIILNKGAIQ